MSPSESRAQLALHGSVVLLIGLLAGIGFSYAAATTTVDSDLYKNWHFAHLEGLLNGVMVLAIAGVWPTFASARRAVVVGKWLLILGAYANTIGPCITALFIGHRVIQPHTPLESLVVYGFYIPGIIPMFAVMAFIWALLGKRRRTYFMP